MITTETKEDVLELVSRHTQKPLEQFEYIKIRRNKTHIVRDILDGGYIRIGSAGTIKDELASHNHLRALGFPVSEILYFSSHHDIAWYHESDLGDVPYALQIRDAQQDPEKISQVFGDFLRIIERYFIAQRHTRKICTDTAVIMHGYHVDIFISELEEAGHPLLPLARKVREKIVTKLPSVTVEFSHGDLGPFNVLDRGIIDFEDSFYGPIGGDEITALGHVLVFPVSGAETNRIFTVTKEMYEKFEVILTPNFRDRFDLAYMLKCFWWCSHEKDRPLLGVFRKGLFEKYAMKFLADESLYDEFKKINNL